MNLLNAYLNQLIESHCRLDAPGLAQQPAPELETVYVPLTVCPDAPALPKPEGEEPAPEQPAELDPTRDFLPREHGQGESGLHISELWERYGYWLVTGMPGSGKSTLLKYLLLNEARAYQQDNGWLPLPVNLIHFAETWARRPAWQPDTALLEYLKTIALQLTASEDPAAADTFGSEVKIALTNHKGLVLCDGLDLLAGPEQQMRCIDAVMTLLSRYPGNRCLVTARPLGDKQRFQQCFRTAALEGFNPEQMRTFFQQWMFALEQNEDLVVDDNTRRRARQKADDIMERLTARPELCTHQATPMLCTLIGVIQRRVGTIPDQPVELYKLCVDTLILQADVQKRRAGLEERQLGKDDMLRLLEIIALYLQEQARNHLHVALLADLTTAALRAGGLPIEAAQRQAADFVELLRLENGLLVELETDSFGFTHLLFQEYLAARALLRPERQLADYLQKYLFHPRWRNIIRLAAAHQGMQSETAGNVFIKNLLNYPHPREALQHYTFRLAFQCMLETRVSLPLADQMFQTWMQLYQQHPVLQPALIRLLDNARRLRYKPRAITPLLDTLQTRDASVRGKAVEALGYLKDPHTLPLLTDLLKSDPYPTVRAKAAEMLGKFKDPVSVPVLLNALHNDAALQVRRRAAQALDKLEHPSVLPALRQSLEHSDSSVRGRAVEALGYLRHPDTVPLLIRLLERDMVAGVRWRAAEALGTHHAGLEALLNALSRDVDTNVRSRVTEALGNFPATAVLPALTKAMQEDRFPAVRWRAAEALGRLHESAAVPMLLTTLETDVDNAVRWSAAEALGELQNPDAVPMLLRSVRNDMDPAVRWSAAESLGRLRDSRAVPVLLDAANYDKYPSVRGKACQALGRLRDNAATPTLIKVLEADENPQVRRNAAEALGHIQDGMAVSVLLHSLQQDADPGVRWSVTEALGNLKDSSVTAALAHTVAHDADLKVRWHAAQVLEGLDLGGII